MTPIDGGPRRRDVVGSSGGGGGITQAYADAHYLQVNGANGMAGLLDISNAAAGQIKFPAVTNPSADPNTLDDYEEGSWTPTVVPSTSGTITLNAASTGRYIRIGNAVTIWARLLVQAIAAPLGAANVNGLPFTLSNSGLIVPVGAATGFNFTAGTVTSINVEGTANQARCAIYRFNAGQKTTAADSFAAGTDASFTLTFFL